MTSPLTIKVLLVCLAAVAAIVLASIVLAASPGTHVDELCWAIVALGIGLLIDRLVP